MADDVITVQTTPAPPDIQEQLTVSTDGQLTDEQKSFLEQFQTDVQDSADQAAAAPAAPAAPAATEEPLPDIAAPPVVPVIPRADYTQVIPDEEVQPEPELPPEVEVDKKAAHAFATLRNQRNSLQNQIQDFNNMIEEFAVMFNIPKELDSKAKADALKEAVVAYRAHKDNIPLEVMQRLSSLESRERNYYQRELDLHNTDAFAKLKEKYSMTDTEVEMFQQELLMAGVDYRKTKMLIESAYRDMHENDILEKRVQSRLNEELNRSQKVEQHATSPSKYVSPEKPLAENADAMQTMQEFNNFINQGLKHI